jgi:hypothetical protein
MAEHVAAAVKQQNHLDILRKAQDDLKQLEHRYLTAYRSARNIKTIMDYQTKLLDIEEKVYQGGNWPDHVEPIPSALRSLGEMYLNLNYVVGLEFTLKGTLHSRAHDGPCWVLNLMELVKDLVRLSQERDESLNWTGSAPPQVLGGRATLRDTARGYIILVCLSGKFAFGLDTKYAQALYHWAGNITERPGDPNIDTEAFRERFVKSQGKLLSWARIKTSRGLELPSRQTIAEFRQDIEKMKAGGEAAQW